VGLAAGLALAAALPELPYACGLATLSLMEGDVVGDPLTAVDGAIAVRRPEVDEVALSRYEIDGTAWRGRTADAQVELEARAGVVR
jgi:O-succinylbenzoate synthase